MQITRVELEKIKSYTTATLEFTEGINAICGENGAGKTTILEAIGFALFNVQPYRPIEQFVREGDRTGVVTVAFISSQDEREYEVVRKCGSSSDYYVYDPELGAKIAEGKTDVLSWLKEQFQLDTVEALETLFTGAVGVPQGLLTVPFREPPAKRKQTFDDLLQVSDYDAAFKSLLGSVQYIKEQIAGVEIEAAGLEAQVAQLPGLERDALKGHDELTSEQAKLDQWTAKLEGLKKERDGLQLQKQSVETLAAQIKTFEERIHGLEGNHNQAKREVQAAALAAKVIKQTAAGHTRYVSAANQLKALEPQQKERDQIVNRKTSLENEKQQHEATIVRLENELRTIQNTQAQMQKLEPRVTRQNELVEAQRQGEALVEKLKSARLDLLGKKGELKISMQESKGVDQELQTRETRQLDKKAAEKTLKELQGRLQENESAWTMLKAEQQRLEQQEQTLRDNESAECPVCRQLLTDAHRKKTLTDVREQLKTLKEQGTGLRAAISDDKRAIKSTEQQIDALDVELESLARPADRQRIEKQLGKLQAEIEALEVVVETLTNSPIELRQTKEDLKTLGNPQAEYHRLEGIASGQKTIQRDLEKTRRAVADLIPKLAIVTGRLHDFGDLDGQSEAAKELQTKYLDDHEQYTANLQVAQGLEDRQKTLTKITGQLDEAQAQRDKLGVELVEQKKAYNARRHQQIIEQFEKLAGDCRELTGRLIVMRKGLKKTDDAIKEIRKLQAQLVKLQTKLKRLQDLKDLVEFMRKLLKQAGPYITQLLVETVSARAARLYSDVMNNPSTRLHWRSEDYEVSLDVGGRSRTFAQLSGGEQMAAALAVRLALLREVSTIDVAFFDEPTANLDETRRENLAVQVANIRDFRQLFVISHDDTFERETNHVVRIEKLNDVSQEQFS